MAERNQRRRLRAAHFLPQLPKDVLVDNIFSRLPTKLVGMLRCESSMLRTELSTARFKQIHLALAHTHEDNVIVVNTDYNLEIMSLPFDESVTYDTGNTCNVIIGSFNGLILYLTVQDTLFLTNPITREQVSLPSPPPHSLLNRGLIVYGFGYDAQNRDYKIVALSGVINDPNAMLVDVFSVNRGLWGSKDNFPYNYFENYFSHGVFLNGNIHWLARRIDGLTVIACFDVVNEIFEEMIAPAVGDDHSKIFVLDGVLGMKLTRHATEFRLMREYGLSNSWRRIHIDWRDFENDLVKPLCSIEENTICMMVGEDDPEMEEKNLILYTLPTRARQRVGQPVRDAGFFRSSLISPIFHN